MGKIKNIQAGFTLIELAVVLVIVGLLLSSFIGTLATRIETTRKVETVEELREIKQAMFAYAYVNDALPCPDCSAVAAGTGTCIAALVGDGRADYDAVAGACHEDEGLGHVPWSTLGIGRNDAWGTKYRYAVQNVYADFTNPFDIDEAAGTAVIQEPDFAVDATGATRKDLARNVVAVIFSHGKNGYGGFGETNVAKDAIPAANTDEGENADDDQFYYMRPETAADATIDGGEFDDLVIWISEFELKAKMVRAGKLPL